MGEGGRRLPPAERAPKGPQGGEESKGRAAIKCGRTQVAKWSENYYYIIIRWTGLIVFLF